MDEYQPAGDISQSLDGKTLYFTETSADPPQEIVSKVLLIADGRNQLIKTVWADCNPASFTIDTDGYYGITPVWQGEDGKEYRGYAGILSTRFHDLAQLYYDSQPPCKENFVNNYAKAKVYRDYAVEAFDAKNNELAQHYMENTTKLVTRAPDAFVNSLTATPIIQQELPQCSTDNDLLTFEGAPINIDGVLLTFNS